MPLYKLILLLSIAICSGCGAHFEPFTNADYRVQATMTAVTAYDWAQTAELKNYHDLEEKNPILGANPTEREINTIIPAAIVTQWLVSWWMPKKYRRKWQLVLLTAESAAVYNNYNHGIRVSF